MAKSKVTYSCQNCGAESPKWLGKCPYCGEWNTYVEEIKRKAKGSDTYHVESKNIHPHLINDIPAINSERIDTKISELNRVLGGGIVPGSLILIGGEPGIGKSTLALQMALLANQLKILYVSGEESDQQIKLRAGRIAQNNDSCYILSETLLTNILYYINDLKPELIIVDSIQTLYSDQLESAPGSVSQVRECAGVLMKTAKESGIPIMLIGHINKEGNIAGPKVLEHMVDTVLQFEGDMHHLYRLLRVTKNRFGATSELAIFEMWEKGLREITNPSEILITQNDENLSGMAIAGSIDGARPFLIEIQSLVSSAVYGTPQRSATGFDTKRLNMLLAVLEKRAGFMLASKDVFLNIAGGIKVDDPGIHLAVVMAILSSTQDIPISKKYCFAGEVGLSGEIRPVSRIQQRIKEAEKLGFERIYLSKYNMKNIDSKKMGLEICYVKQISDLLKEFF
jgi:DNA repair protein RadA/Sms